MIRIWRGQSRVATPEKRCADTLAHQAYFGGLQNFRGGTFRMLLNGDLLRLFPDGSWVLIAENDDSVQAISALNDNQWHELPVGIRAWLAVVKDGIVVPGRRIQYRLAKTAEHKGLDARTRSLLVSSFIHDHTAAFNFSFDRFVQLIGHKEGSGYRVDWRAHDPAKLKKEIVRVFQSVGIE